MPFNTSKSRKLTCDILLLQFVNVFLSNFKKSDMLTGKLSCGVIFKNYLCNGT